VGEVVESSVPLADQARVRIHSVGSLPTVRADRVYLERVVTNLISNALKFSPAGAPVEVRLGRGEDDIVISVLDRGIGMGQDTLSHVFERYYRGPPAAPREGMGLGLYNSRLIVEALGGCIWATSAPNVGSTFSVSLPSTGR